MNSNSRFEFLTKFKLLSKWQLLGDILKFYLNQYYYEFALGNNTLHGITNTKFEARTRKTDGFYRVQTSERRAPRSAHVSSSEGTFKSIRIHAPSLHIHSMIQPPHMPY
jgi:hypothetical protein